MLSRRAKLFGALLSLLLAYWGWQWLHQPPRALSLPNGASLEWTDCWFDTSWWHPVHCGRLHTRTEPGAQPASFSLPVVYASAHFWARTRPPVVYVAGGPGGATGLDTEIMPVWLDWLEQVDWPADVIFYDQRGVGLSEPALDCAELREQRRQLLDSELPAEAQYQALFQAMLACQARLQGEGWDLGRFNTRSNAADVLDLVATLGLEEWQLYGVSYGTRVALELMRDEAQGLQAVVLDSVYPPQVHGERANAWLLNRSLRLFTRTCELVPDCDYHRERLAADLEKAMQRLRERPQRIDLRDPDDGRAVPVVMDHEDLAWLIFESQYTWSNLQLLPGAINALAGGHVSSELRNMMQLSLEGLLDESLSEAVGNSVECADNGPLDEAGFEAQRRQFDLVAPLLRLDWRYGACRGWHSGDVGDDFRQPVHSEIPTLLLAGEFDPVTPPQWAYRAAQGLPNSYLLTFPGIGHGVIDSDACAVDVVQAFWQKPAAPSVPVCVSLF